MHKNFFFNIYMMTDDNDRKSYFLNGFKAPAHKGALHSLRLKERPLETKWISGNAPWSRNRLLERRRNGLLETINKFQQQKKAIEKQ
ncbi:unnamed protein product [Rhizophagus irregularis]|nr:unnamed protein product [Rhizophagus irregularis]